MSWTERQLDPDSQDMLDRVARPWSQGRAVDRKRAEDAVHRHLERLGMPRLPIRWAADAVHGYTAARVAGRSNLGNSRDPLWVNRVQDLRASVREKVWNRIYTDVLSDACRAWTQDDNLIMMLALGEIDHELKVGFSRQRGPLGIRDPIIVPDDSVVGAAAQGIAWNALYAETGDPKVNQLALAWLPFVDALEAGAWLYWVVDAQVIMVQRPVIHRDSRNRYHRVDGPAVDWQEGEGLYFWNGVAVPEDLVRHPERITVRMIDQERNAEVRRVMVERYGVERYLLDGNAQVVHRDHRGTLLRKDLPGDEPIVMIRVTNSTPEPDGTHKDYFIRVPPTMTNASVAVAWTFGIEPHEYYDPLKET